MTGFWKAYNEEVVKSRTLSKQAIVESLEQQIKSAEWAYNLAKKENNRSEMKVQAQRIEDLKMNWQTQEKMSCQKSIPNWKLRTDRKHKKLHIKRIWQMLKSNGRKRKRVRGLNQRSDGYIETGERSQR